MDKERTIRLDQFLKVVGAVETGGQAKLLIQSGDVQVNGEVERHRSRKLVSADTVVLAGTNYTVEFESNQ